MNITLYEGLSGPASLSLPQPEMSNSALDIDVRPESLRKATGQTIFPKAILSDRTPSVTFPCG